jgi:hypothetical protein
MTAIAAVRAPPIAGETNKGEELIIIARIRYRFQTKIRL